MSIENTTLSIALLEDLESNDNVYSMDPWILDSCIALHVCLNKEGLDTYKPCDNGVLDTTGYDYSVKDGVMIINKGDLVVMNDQKIIGKTILGRARPVEPLHGESCSRVKEVASLKQCTEGINQK
ncbi:hypothetical protein PanWU01x14_144900 [Parasponia andersonii]|uniref:Uncharacterized protein n=1 Tax=Parasponia andersonii TaxID=3476 RepID=A0A2P5CKL1_PARAD|nr:hypothetical protein PanWU01x14_144900 [Parasponia andersonii]